MCIMYDLVFEINCMHVTDVCCLPLGPSNPNRILVYQFIYTLTKSFSLSVEKPSANTATTNKFIMKDTNSAMAASMKK